jgi:hypothetical protein
MIVLCSKIITVFREGVGMQKIILLTGVLFSLFLFTGCNEVATSSTSQALLGPLSGAKI